MGSLMNPVTTRVRILSDHDHLRWLMTRVTAGASEALRDEKRRPWFRAILAELRTELEQHLDYEEKELVPLLASADAWGPLRVEHLLKDHAGQRALLVALTEDAADGARSMECLAEEIEWFVRSFERDMLDEEATFLNAEALGEDLFVVDQIDG
jgi:hypothetical protein